MMLSRLILTLPTNQNTVGMIHFLIAYKTIYELPAKQGVMCGVRSLASGAANLQKLLHRMGKGFAPQTDTQLCYISDVLHVLAWDL